MLLVPNFHNRWRFVIIALAVVTFGWLSVEDTQMTTVAILGVLISALTLCVWTMRRFGGQLLTWQAAVVALPLFGGVIGLGATLSTTALMFFKTAWHSHIYPDFPTPMLLAMLSRAPIWMLSGFLLGLAGVCWMGFLRMSQVADEPHLE